CGEAHRVGAAAVPSGREPGRGSSAAMVSAPEGGRRRGPGGGAARMGLAASGGPERSGRWVDRLPGAERAPDGIPRVPGTRLVHRQRRGGERVQDGRRPETEVGRHALGGGRSQCRLPTSAPSIGAKKASGRHSGTANSPATDRMYTN